MAQAQANVQRAEAGLGQMQAKLDQADRDWKRAQELGPSNALAQSSYDAYKAACEIAKANLAVGQAVVVQDKGAVVQAQAALDRAQRNLLFSHVAHGINAGTGVPYQTGIALVNPFGAPVGCTISVFDGYGALVAQSNDTLAPHQKVAKILSHPVAGAGFFTQPLTLGSGHVEVVSDYGLLDFELFFTEDLSQLASVPAQNGN